MPRFIDTVHPTPFGSYDNDPQFQQEADAVVPWVKRRLGDDVVSVELTNKMIFACLEEATGEATRHLHEARIRNDMVHVLGMPTGSDMTNRYPRQTLEYLLRMTEPYGSIIGVGGSTDSELVYLKLEPGKQDYSLYTDVISNDTKLPVTGSNGGKIRVIDVWHNDPIKAFGSYQGAGYGSGDALALQDMYGAGTTYAVLPVFEDILRRNAVEMASRVRRSWYSYQIIGGNIRIYPTPTDYRINQGHDKLFMRIFAGPQDAFGAGSNKYIDSTITGVSGMHQVPFFNIPFNTFNQPLKAWIRQYCLALCMETLGRVRSKMGSIPIPGGELRLDGPELIQQANTLRERLATEMKELLGSMSTSLLLEQQLKQAEQLNRTLQFIPIKGGITTG